jgi:two-component system sensor histidine kinase BaeS
MLDSIRSHLAARLLLSYLAVIVSGLVVLAAASQFALPSSFNRHMLGMLAGAGANAPGGLGMGQGPARQGTANSAMRSQLFVDYRAGFNDALLIAGLAALSVAVLLSWLLSRGVTGPVHAMAHAAQRIALGHYEERVPVAGADELAELASRFNEMAGKLDEVESTRRRLIADVSHELRTPLTAIQGSMEGLMDGVLPAGEDTYQQVYAEAARLNRLVDDLQELSRVEARAYQLDLQPLDVDALIQTIIKRFAAQAAARDITLDWRPAPGLPRVRGDEDRLVQVLSNLVSNALQYTPEGGRLEVAAVVEANHVQFSVTDDGAGIASEHLGRIFDRFYRIDKSRSRQSGGGSGIGLTIARLLVEAHGGRIWAESPGPGKGSTFNFTVPVAP